MDSRFAALAHHIYVYTTVRNVNESSLKIRVTTETALAVRNANGSVFNYRMRDVEQRVRQLGTLKYEVR